MFEPEGHSTWVSLLQSKEPSDQYFYTYIGTGSPNKWITPCAHPSVKSHHLLAELLYKHIEGIK